jgi:hypothetical protein
MFVNETLKKHIEESGTLRLNSAVVAEWNMNIAENILRVGNYRYRPLDTESPQYNFIAQSFSFDDSSNMFYTGATDADIIIDGGIGNDNSPKAFTLTKEKEKLLYSLEDCFGRFRPRSGINKLRYFENRFSHFPNVDMALRPRYYVASRNDSFKYWTSYRTENGVEMGVANQVFNNQNYINDAAPFVVYKEPVPANRIVAKLQTHVGEIDLGPFQNSGITIEDPFYGQENNCTPSKWQVQYLDGNNNWITISSFDETSTRKDGSPVFKADGYFELFYGLNVPEEFSNNFALIKEVLSEASLPNPNGMPDGSAYLVLPQQGAGTLHIVKDNSYIVVDANYGWSLDEEDVASKTQFVKSLTSPPSFVNPVDSQITYREFQYVKGLRIVVETMNVFDSSLELIELSPRLSVDFSDKATQFSLNKNASDLGITGLPVGQLLASTGSVDFFDYDQAFFAENPSSIISKYLSQNIQFKFYEIVNIPDDGFYYVPIKTMYSEGFPKVNNSNRNVSIELRDLFFYFESAIAPQMLIQDASVSSAVALLLDSIGFSNYIFKRNENESEDLIPYFFIEPDTSIAEILNEIARSTQTAMFFDEYNNFVLMSKNYIMPTIKERVTDISLYGSKDFQRNAQLRNEATSNTLSNIVGISSQDNSVYNSGSINYTTRSIQKAFSSIRQASLLDKDKTWIYKPALLWEVTGEETTKSINEEVSTQSDFVLGAIPLNSDLSSSIPSVVNGEIVNNTIDLGDAVYHMTRYKGYFFANGEIIKFDAVQYSIPGLTLAQKEFSGIDNDNVWISSVQEYQKYFSKIPFNGKMYPTGLVRIYAEPTYTEIPGGSIMTGGQVAKHGRGQFGTEIVYHNAGLSEHWTSPSNLRGCIMNSKYVFLDNQDVIFVENAELVSNDPVAEFSVPNVDAFKAGLFVRKVGGEIADNAQINEIIPRTTISAVDSANNKVILSAPISDYVPPTEGGLFLDLEFFDGTPNTEIGLAGQELTVYKSSIRTGLIKNMLSNRFVEEVASNVIQPGTIQSSAFVFKGDISSSNKRINSFISYVYKPLDNRFKHFGTRMRIVGKVENNEYRGQSPEGSSVYYNLSNIKTGDSPSVSGSSGGIAIMINPETNNGYFFEIMALSGGTSTDDGETPIYNMVFYKLLRNSSATSDSEDAIPIRLWAGSGKIGVDNGLFTGQGRLTAEENPTVYDLAVEYKDIEGGRRFYLYVNGVVVGSVDDPDPLPVYQNIALFVRGNAKCMFENVYALTENYSQNTTFSLDAPAQSVFGVPELTAKNSFQKYAVSGLIQSTYLSGIGTEEPPRYNIYFEEFGTIMREASYFDVRYDKAYPALLAQISPTPNNLKGYTVSGFVAGSYGAEFLIFNNTDTALLLDSTSGNYLRIQGVTFTQESQHELTVDDYFEKVSNFTENVFTSDANIQTPLAIKKQFDDIKLSRLTQGQKSFSLDAAYLQTQDAAENMMEWFSTKIMKPRRSVGVDIFCNPMIQLGDIVEVNYVNENGFNEISSDSSRFVVYSIDYSRSSEGPSMTIFLSEVK